MPEPIVVDTSSLIALEKISLLPILFVKPDPKAFLQETK